jgi:hypothetical protein
MTRRLGFGAPRPFDAQNKIATERDRHADDGWHDLNAMTDLPLVGSGMAKSKSASSVNTDANSPPKE